jgi:chromosome partitioning protein
MHVITVSGFKGGTGKTTIASLLAVGACMDGLRVAVLDLDRNTRNMSNFLGARKASGLKSPDHVMLMELDAAQARKGAGRLAPLVRMAKLDGYDLMVIDTSSGDRADLFEAHLLADTIITPMNESPADLHGLFTPGGAPQAPVINYRDFIETVRFDRRRAGLPKQKWHICRNRTSALPTKVGAIVGDRVDGISAQLGFDRVHTLRDRVVHRGIALEGRTVFDPPVEGQKLTMSELAGRSEIRAMLAAVHISAADEPVMELTKIAA